MASQYDVAIVGAGCAGLTAAVGLARAGFKVAVVEAARVAGGTGLLAGVCFAESLMQPDILGAEVARTLPWERRLVERGSFATDGKRLAGCIYRDSDAFFPCYTILRSRFNPKLAELAGAYAASLRMETAVESLIRDGRRIIGVATTHGPLYADLVFLAEGDAGFLVSREGLDRSTDPRDQPAFLYCLQQIRDLPADAIEQCFGVGPDQGVAYDFLLRNPASLPLNARGHLGTNRQGLTLSIVLPASNLHQWFKGEPRQLLDWFVDMPVLRRWLRDSRPRAWTAALLRTGGLRDVPYLIEDGLVVGGAVAGLGLDFPVMNAMGPATATGLLLARAAVRIRAEGRGFDREELTRLYLEPLQGTRYWRDMEFVQRWPGYRERARVLFGHGLDLLLDSASVWARRRRWLPWKLFAWLRVLTRISWRQWNELRDEVFHIGRVLRLHDVTSRPVLARLLLDGCLNAFRDLARRPRPDLPPRGTLRLHYHAVDEEGRASAAPWLFRRWFERVRPVLAAVGHILHVNDDSPLSVRLSRSFELLLRQINLFDLLAVGGLALPIMVLTMTLLAWNRVVPWKRRRSHKEVAWSEHSKVCLEDTLDLKDVTHSEPPRIRIAWRSTQPEQQAECVRDLPHICPARVFEVRGLPPEKVRVVVHPQRCVFCHACWRMNGLVDWGRNVASPSPSSCKGESEAASPNDLGALLNDLERRLGDFAGALHEQPALVDRPHNDYLEMLARFAQQLAYRVREHVHSQAEIAGELRRPVLDLADALVSRADERTRRAWEGRFSWAAADGRLLAQHHLAQLRRLLSLPAPTQQPADRVPLSQLDWAAAISPSQLEDATVKHLLADMAARQYLLEAIEAAATAKSLPGELLAEFVADQHHTLAARMQEMKSILDNRPSPFPVAEDSDAWQAYRSHGRSFLNALDETRKLLDVPGAWDRMAQLRVLRAECQELAESERRLLALASDWRESKPQAADEEVSTRFGRQATHILAGKLLILQTFERLEKGNDAELAMLLLRVWLDHAGTLLDEYALLVRQSLAPVVRRVERPLVEPESGAPLRSQAEYLAAPAIYHSGDFLLVPLDLLQPCLVPEMIGEEDIAVADPNGADLVGLWNEVKQETSSLHMPSNTLYLAETLAVDTIGRHAADPIAGFDLEWACARLIVAGVHPYFGALRERCTILRALAEVVMPRLRKGDLDSRLRHLHRDVLELEALKADFRRRLEAAWLVFGEALGRNADVRASCFALAEAAAWLKAADSTLGRMAWISRLCQAEDREEPASQQELARRALARCFAEIRDRLFRFDEDLASLRRGYYAPHVYASAMLLRGAHVD